MLACKIRGIIRARNCSFCKWRQPKYWGNEHVHHTQHLEAEGCPIIFGWILRFELARLKKHCPHSFSIYIYSHLVNPLVRISITGNFCSKFLLVGYSNLNFEFNSLRSNLRVTFLSNCQFSEFNTIPRRETLSSFRSPKSSDFRSAKSSLTPEIAPYRGWGFFIF